MEEDPYEDSLCELSEDEHDSKLTELHSVIAELLNNNKKKTNNVIFESDEEEYFEDDLLIEEDVSLTSLNPCTLSDNDNEKNNIEEELSIKVPDASVSAIEEENNLNLDNTKPVIDESIPEPCKKDDNNEMLLEKLLKINEEVSVIRAEHYAIRETLRQKEIELEKAKKSVISIASERDALRIKVTKLESLLHHPHPQNHLHPHPHNNNNYPHHPHLEQISSSPIKTAKIKKLHNNNNNKSIISTTKTAEIITNLAEIKCESSFYCHGNHCKKNKNTSDLDNPLSSLEAEGESEMKNEVQRLSAKVENVKAQNGLLSRNLEDAKFYCDRVGLLLGRYESRYVLSRIVINIGEQTIEGYDILVALLESELGQLLANCRAAGIGNNNNHKRDLVEEEDVNLLLAKANQNRVTAETAAGNLLKKMNVPHGHFLHQGDYNGPASGDSIMTLEKTIRQLIINLKTEKQKMENDLMRLQPMDWNMEPLFLQKVDQKSQKERENMDLETAVLMQELMGLREERAELRGRVLALQKRLHCCLGNPNQSTGICNNKNDDNHRNGTKELSEEKNNNEKTMTEHNLQIVSELKESNELLLETLEEVKTKYQNRIKRMEEEICKICERHAKEILYYRNLVHCY